MDASSIPDARRATARRAAVLLLVLAGCTSANPLFGDGGGGGSGDTSTGDGIADASATGAAMTAGDAGDTGDTTGGPVPVCGNGVQEEGEECDLGGENSPTGGCQLDCTGNECGDGKVGPGQPCDDGPDGSATCGADCVPLTCGDGVVQGENGEECEPSTDSACTPICTLNVCGDGFMLGAEACDDNNADNTDACVAGCQHAICGDGYVQAGVEDCDDDNGYNTDACLVSCTWNTCGDGFVHMGEEECDDQNGSNLDACLTDCTLNVCGDGFVNSDAEQCDGDVQQSCADLGFDGGEAACSIDCTIEGCSTCGDGVVGDGEECDPGSFVDTSCAEANLQGSGMLSCDEQNCIVVVVAGDCCVPAGQSCSEAIGCCNGCDEGTEQCQDG